jgi:hypothetical protein
MSNNNGKPTWVQQSSKTEVYNALALPFILHKSTILTVRQKDKKRLTSFQMKFFRTAGHTLFDHRRNEEIVEELKVEPVDEKLIRYKSNWLRHVARMKNKNMSKIMLNCEPKGRRRLGRPLKRLLDETEAGLSRPNS